MGLLNLYLIGFVATFLWLMMLHHFGNYVQRPLYKVLIVGYLLSALWPLTIILHILDD